VILKTTSFFEGYEKNFNNCWSFRPSPMHALIESLLWEWGHEGNKQYPIKKKK
jgi:hypothetical protein